MDNTVLASTANTAVPIYTLPTTFPADLEVNLSLRVRVQSEEDAKYYIDEVTGKCCISFIADIMDGGGTELAGELIAVNGETPESIQRKMQLLATS